MKYRTAKDIQDDIRARGTRAAEDVAKSWEAVRASAFQSALAAENNFIDLEMQRKMFRIILYELRSYKLKFGDKI